MGADLGVPLSDLRPLCVSVAGGESRKTFTQFSKRENVKTSDNAKIGMSRAFLRNYYKNARIADMRAPP